MDLRRRDRQRSSRDWRFGERPDVALADVAVVSVQYAQKDTDLAGGVGGDEGSEVVGAATSFGGHGEADDDGERAGHPRGTVLRDTGPGLQSLLYFVEQLEAGRREFCRQAFQGPRQAPDRGHDL